MKRVYGFGENRIDTHAHGVEHPMLTYNIDKSSYGYELGQS